MPLGEMLVGDTGGQIGTVLVDGLVNATWSITGAKNVGLLAVRPSLRLPKTTQAEIQEEGGGY